MSKGYDRAQRADVVRPVDPSKPAMLKSVFQASSQSPLVNLCLVVRNWGDPPAVVTVHDRVSDETVRIGHVGTLEGTDLLVWLAACATAPVTVTVGPAS